MLAVLAINNTRLISDYVRYYQYVPDDTIASFVEQAGMNEYGKFLFYASHPSLETAETFNLRCEKKEQTTAAVLGCYDGVNIYVYDVPDERLSAVRPTTAAHEMLHAAFRRLNDRDRRAIENLLEAEYLKLKDDKEFSERMQFYAVTQPGDRTNELHSIIGTEIAVISEELEEYYQRYFSDRSKVVAQHKKYHIIFEELTARADQLNTQINEYADVINNKRAEYNRLTTIIQSDIENFNARAQNSGFDSQMQFYVERQALVARTQSLEILRSEINNAITEYNQLVNELNNIATETEKLNRSIDSSLEPAPSL